jgi:pimeloyl-ACP methyl ester carboxylesterase
VLGAPVWFGPSERPLFGWLHVPAGASARGAAVLCPTFGLEGGFSHFALRQVAERLADKGFVALRFDYDGTGDSSGSGDDPGRVAAWTSSVGAAVDLVASIADVPVALVGMRIGALFAVEEAARRGGVKALVLWDPPASGRSYVREQRTRHSVSFDDAQDPAVVTALGMTYTADTVAGLDSLHLRSYDPLPAVDCLLLVRPGRGAARIPINTARGEATAFEADDQDGLLLEQRLPSTSIRRITEWLSDTFDDIAPAAVKLPERRTSIRLGSGAESVVERVAWLGPNNLFGVVSEPAYATSGPTVVFVPDAHTPHTGLSRMWVDLARSLARDGLRSVRFDLSGNGDSPIREGYEAYNIFAPEHLDDVLDAVRAISPTDPSNVVMVGICSGAYHSIEAALELSPRGICIMNPTFAFVTSEWPPDSRRGARQATRRSLAVPLGKPLGRLARGFSPHLRNDASFNWGRWLESCFWQHAIARRKNLSDRSWRILNRSLLGPRVPTTILSDVADRNTELFVLVGDEEYAAIARGARRELDALTQRPGVRLAALAGLDHSVLKAGQRARVLAQLTEHIAERFASAERPDRESAA